MTRLVDDILRAVVERRLLVLDLQQHPDPAGSLKKTPDEWRTEKLPGREDFPLGLRPSVHPSPMEQHTDPDSKRKFVLS